MELKINDQSIHTVQIEGKDVQVVPVEEAKGLITQAQTELTQAVDKATKDTKTTVHRELSKSLGVNLFDDNAVSQFVENQKEMVSKNEVEQYTKRIAELEPIEKEYKTLQFDFAITKNNVDTEQVDKVKKLAELELVGEDMTYEKAVAKVIEDFPFFVKGKKKGGMDPNYTPDSKTEYERHVADNPNYKNNPYFKK